MSEQFQADGVRIRLDIAYDGTNFNGWGIQPILRTVQGDIESALATILQRNPPIPRLTVAGRTDAGVHATGQVAHLDLSPEQADSLLRPPRGRNARAADTDAAAALARRLNGILGQRGEIVITAASIAPEGFDARFGALWRRYEYRIADAESLRDPLQRTRTTWLPGRHDIAPMEQVAQALCGLHDFAAYCKPKPMATTIRTLQTFSWRRDDDGVLVASLQADAFCHSMVRALVGGCVAVGEGRMSVERLLELRDARERTAAFKVMPARGLVLTQVGYPDDAALALRAAETRAHRAL
ncbi:tRNA pseudouridine(38-40) synthase TruA [Microterricola viridarii]|uniref:tRNA pseudouridine synthase A n=1 Tax=Microterricola viridarii TaxID=412690 RepID=A0A1H1Q5S3_9MICO|nr:tRNA pseudouridine(38-40) synthase TruA [Microterricola viridarii]SDS18349.1 tRNA pseudouridine38-40 synthase [Microterricola viridarii]